MNRKTAIVTDVRYRMSLAIIRDLAQAGIKVVAVEFDGSTPPLGFFSKYTAKCVFMDEDKYLDQLWELCKAEYIESGEKPALMPVSNATMKLLVKPETRERFEEVAGICIPSEEQLIFLNDKGKLHALAENLGIPVPKEYDVNDRDITYPCVVKPLCGEHYGIKAKDRYRIVNNEIQMKAAYARFTKMCEGEKPVIQQYINGDGCGCSVFAKDGKVMASITHKRVREYPISGGPSTCCKVIHNGNLQDYTETLVKAVALNGVAMFEYKQGADGTFYLLESNPRVWGSYPLTRCARCNITQQWFAESFRNGNPGTLYKAPSTDFRDVKMNFMLTDMRAGVSYIRDGRVRLGLMAFIDALNPKVKGGLFEWGDPKPAFKYVSGYLKRRDD